MRFKIHYYDCFLLTLLSIMIIGVIIIIYILYMYYIHCMSHCTSQLHIPSYVALIKYLHYIISCTIPIIYLSYIIIDLSNVYYIYISHMYKYILYTYPSYPVDIPRSQSSPCAMTRQVAGRTPVPKASTVPVICPRIVGTNQPSKETSTNPMESVRWHGAR